MLARPIQHPCEILAPEDGSAGPEGETIDLRHGSDADVEDLSVTWAPIKMVTLEVHQLKEQSFLFNFCQTHVSLK